MLLCLQKLKNRTSDITRGTVQKSVCVLSTLPLYGHIQVKMALITHAYFDEGDFSKVSLLEDTYHHLNSCMSGESQIPPQIFVGNYLRAKFLINGITASALYINYLQVYLQEILYCNSVTKCCSYLNCSCLRKG